MKFKKTWKSNYRAAILRCLDETDQHYSEFGAKGIKMLMSAKDVESLWVRDCAEKMKSPSLKRKDQNGHYEFSNCVFLEHTSKIKE